MKIAVFGSTGKTGSLIVKQALTKGHKVIAFVHKSEKVESNVWKTIEGDATNYNDVEQAVQDADVIISAIGHVKGSSDDVQTIAIKHMIRAMRQHGKARIVSITGAAVPAVGDPISFRNWFMRLGLRLFDPSRYRDGFGHSRALRASDLDYTIVRCPIMNKKDISKKLRVDRFGLGPLATVSHRDVARFCIECVENKSHIRDEPMISW